jgi:hypothetical protein
VGIRCADYATLLYPQKLALASLTSGGCSVGIVRSRTEATKFVCYREPEMLCVCVCVRACSCLKYTVSTRYIRDFRCFDGPDVHLLHIK